MFSDVDECASNPCSNGGTCDNLVDHFLCYCAAGYDNTTCNIGMCEIKRWLLLTRCDVLF